MIQNTLGLHARASAKLVALVSTFDCETRLKRDDLEVDAASMMSVMTLAASQGTHIEIYTHGRQETEAMEALVELIYQRFGEDA